MLYRVIALGFGLALSACRGTRAVAAHPVDQPVRVVAVAPSADVPPADDAARVDGSAGLVRVRVVRGATVSLGGVPHVFARFVPAGLIDPVGFVALADPAGVEHEAPTQGCLHTAGANVRVDALEAAPPGAAELTVVPYEAQERAVAWGEAVVLPLGDRLRSPDGDVVRVRRFRARMGALLWDLEVRSGEGPVEAVTISLSPVVFGGDRLATSTPTDRRDALGCPLLGITLDRPSVRIVEASEGVAVELPQRARARLGALTIRYDGLGTRRLRVDGDIVQVSLSITLGAATETREARVGETLNLVGYTVEVLWAGPQSARMRLRRRAP